MLGVRFALLALLLSAASVALAQVRLHATDLRATQILGVQVVSQIGQPLGRITDFLLDPTSGKVELVNFGGSLYPVGVLSAGDHGEVLADLGGVSASAGGTAATRSLVRATAILGRTFTDSAGKSLGQVKDLVVDALDRKVRLAVLQPASGAMVALPLDALDLASGRVKQRP